MPTHRLSAYAAAPPERVFDLWIDLDRMPDWVGGSLQWTGSSTDVDELYQQQLTETDPKKREEMLHRLQQILHERTRFAPIWDYFWPSGLGPRVEEASLMKIDPFPWSNPLEDVKLKK